VRDVRAVALATTRLAQDLYLAGRYAEARAVAERLAALAAQLPPGALTALYVLAARCAACEHDASGALLRLEHARRLASASLTGSASTEADADADLLTRDLLHEARAAAAATPDVAAMLAAKEVHSAS
jgi:hypothetical protein